MTPPTTQREKTKVKKTFKNPYPSDSGYTFGHLQRKTHALLDEKFDSRKEAYLWLEQTFKIKHLSEVKSKEKIEEIWAKLICL